MKKLNLKHVIVVLSLNLVVGLTAQANTIWTAIEVGKDIMTSHEVAKFIDAIVISPSLHAELFKKSQNDYTSYIEQKNKLTAELFKETATQLTIIRILQAQAIRTTKRKFFSLSKEQQSSQLEGAIKLAMKPFNKSGFTKAMTRELFVKDLKAKGVPYDNKASTEEIYTSWSKQLKIRLIEQYRQKEAVRYLCSIGDCETYGSAAVFSANRSYFEKNNHVVMRFNENVQLKGAAAFDSLTYKSDAQENNTESKNVEKTIFYLGKIVNEKTELIHVNDWNLLGSIGESLGYPDTDDQGRTSGIIFGYTREGEKGSLTVEMENWLFTEKLPEVDGLRQQNVEEETSLRIISKKFLDEKGDKWVIVGISATNRVQKESLGSWLQENFHKLNPGTRVKINNDRDGAESFAQGLFGLGGKYSIIESDHIDLVITGEGILAPAVGIISESSLIIMSSLDVNIYGKSKELPVLQIGVFAEIAIGSTGSIDSKIGGKIVVAKNIKRVRLEAGLFVIRWDGELDRRYEGAASWTTGILLSASVTPRSKFVDYAFN